VRTLRSCGAAPPGGPAGTGRSPSLGAVDRGLPQAPRWAWIVMAFGLIWLVVGFVLLENRPAPPGFTAATPAPASAAGSGQKATRVLVVGDSYTAGTPIGGLGPAGWAHLVADDLGITVDVAAAGGSGYVAKGPTGHTFTDLVSAAGTGYDAVVFFGSRNDPGDRTAVQTGANRAFIAARAATPDGKLLVVGPPWVNAKPPASIQAVRVAVQNAATAAGATFVDPLDRGWFYDRPELIGSDGVHPTDAGHRYLADLIGPELAAVLAAR
jgi:lysophospholipase L1-like esterase